MKYLSIVSWVFFSMYFFLLFISFFLLSVSGGRVEYYAFLGIIGSIPAISNNSYLRLFVILAVSVSMLLLINDFRSGNRLQKRVFEMQLQHEKNKVIHQVPVP